MELRDANQKDFTFVYNLNDENVEVLSEMDEKQFEYFVKYAELFLICEIDGRPVAFMICLGEGLESYESENYIWFSRNCQKFLYIDRIVIDEDFRSLGIGRKLYERVFDYAKKEGLERVTAEIDLIPYNESSLKFHEKMGFREAATQFVREGSVKVSLQVHELK